MARTTCLVCFISTVNGHCNKKKKKRKEEAYPWKAGASSRHTTNLKQSILRLSISMVASLTFLLEISKVFPSSSQYLACIKNCQNCDKKNESS